MVEVLEHGRWSLDTVSYDNPHRNDEDFCYLCLCESFSGVGVPERERALARCPRAREAARERDLRQLARAHLTRLHCLTRLRLDLHLDLRRRRCRNSAGCMVLSLRLRRSRCRIHCFLTQRSLS